MKNVSNEKTVSLEFIGKIRVPGEEQVKVSIFDARKREVILDLPRDYFPKKNLRAGDIFRYEISAETAKRPHSYRTTVIIEDMSIRKLSKKEISDIYRRIRRVLPEGS